MNVKYWLVGRGGLVGQVAKSKFHAAPPLKNPYMEAIENVEGIMQRLSTFRDEFPDELTAEQKDDCVADLLSVRDQLHEMYRLQQHKTSAAQ